MDRCAFESIPEKCTIRHQVGSGSSEQVYTLFALLWAADDSELNPELLLRAEDRGLNLGAEDGHQWMSLFF